ncbi:hypothetical protein L7F22_041722 [Adiantum nelumboides]|nr:hypothetical protein [Adiantum nelumboides]
MVEAPKEDVHCKGSPLSYAWGKVREHDAFIPFDPGSTHNFISLELATKLGVQDFEMGDAMKADGSFIGQDVSVVTPLIGKLRLHIQGYVDKEEFPISPLKHEDDILGAPWFDHLAASIKFLERRISFKFREKDMYINAQESGIAIPLVNEQAFVKSSIFAYMIVVKDSLNGVNETQVNESGMQEELELSNFLSQFQDVFIDDILGELPPKRGDDDHMIELIPGSSSPNKPPYRVSRAQQEEIMRQVNELVEKGMDHLTSINIVFLVLPVRPLSASIQQRRLLRIVEMASATAQVDVKTEELSLSEHYELLQSIHRIPSIDKAWLLSSKADAKHSLEAMVAFNEVNLVANSRRKYLSFINLPKEQTKEAACSWSAFPFELTGVSLLVPSLSGQKLLVVRNSDSTSKNGGNPTKLEVWTSAQLVKEILVPASIHGSVYADGWFEGVSWSHDESYVAYVAEESATSKPVFGKTHVSFAVQAKDNDAHSWKGQGDWQEDWGESYTGKGRPCLYVADLQNGSVQKVDGVPDDLSVGQVTWAPDDSQVLIFVGWPMTSSNFNTSRRLGIKYCYNRPCALYAVQAFQDDRISDSLSSVWKLTRSIGSAFLPRFSPNGKHLMFLSAEGAVTTGVHCGTNSLHILEWHGLEHLGTNVDIREVVSVAQPAGGFPGIYCQSIIASPWLSDNRTVLLSSPWHSTQVILAIDIERFSKQAHFIPVRKKIKPDQMARLFMSNIFKYHGMPQSIVSDRDPRMTSLFWRGLFENMGTMLKFSSSFHPQTDGQAEEANSTVLDLLKCYVSEHKGKWEQYLPLVKYAYNNIVHSSTDKAPFEIVEGGKKVPPILHTKDKIFEADKYVQDMDEMYKKVKVALEKTQAKQKKATDSHRREADVQAQLKATTTSPPKPDSKKQYSEKELEEEIDARLARILGAQKQGKKHDRKQKKSIDFPGYLGSQSTFDKAKKHKKRAAVPSSSSSSESSSESSEEERRSKKRSRRHRHGKGKRKTRKSRSRRADDSSTKDSSTDSSDSEDGHFYANKKNFYKANQYDFLEDKSKKVREFKEGGQSIKFETFSGYKDASKALSFIQQFDIAFVGGRYSEHSKIRRAASYFKGNARTCVIEGDYNVFKRGALPCKYKYVGWWPHSAEHLDAESES